LTLRKLTITKGRALGLFGAGGGGILNNGTLTVTNSTFSGNNATGFSGTGGGIRNNGGTLTVTNSTFQNNSAAVDGGAISNGGTLTVTNSTFSGNSARWGGGIRNNGTLTVTGSTFSGNSAVSGGGIWNNGTLTVTGSTFSNNGANDYGGGIANFGGTLTVTNSTFSGNSASAGGGIRNFGGTLTVTNSTFSGNSANYGGGIDNSGTLTVTNSTLSGNSANYGGGGIYNDGTATLQNTIIANSASGGDCVGTLSGTSNNNLIESTGANACGLMHGSAGNILGQDPNLGSLTGNPAYFPLNPGSPAMDAGDNATCAATDQRGVSRPQDGDLNGTAVCDIGAYETAFPNLQAAKTNNVGGAAVPGVPFTWTVTVKNSGAAAAAFNNGQVILRDYLPAGASYDTPLVQNVVNVTNGGNIACAIAGNVLSCTANAVTVTLGAESGQFDVAFGVTPTAAGTLANPTGGVCRADPDALVGESNETDNDCANTVTVTARVYLPLVWR
ncbi:MAG: right-handed parallel beta-helix repeat-containing protein, partial [Anaerolineae bacterium]|nr:right-handed parallel beta-helix repeat-containing protein [Candidatus Roseilinea sp.]MDW8448717.1 right-handed parallel beta-helix repeat-containing protein [Anaerolineae bacterium]